MKNIKDTFVWSSLELLIVPVFLTGLSFYFDGRIAQRDRRREYLKDITELVSKAAEKEGGKIRDTPNFSLKALARARTLTILRESDGKSKREIVEFLANSDLQYQISLANADLRNADLSGLYLKDADLSNANLKGSNLNDAKLLGVDLRSAKLNGARLNQIEYDNCTFFDDGLDLEIEELQWKKEEGEPNRECLYK